MNVLPLIFVMACLAQFASAATPSEAEADVSPDGCRVVKDAIRSPAMQRDIRVAVMLPPGYEADASKRYPVLYALHGKGAPYDVWTQMNTLREALTTKPMIIAAFDCDDAGWYIDSTVKPDSQFETFFFDEFMPHVESRYRANGVRGVTGFSMGGFGALHYATRRPDLFSSVSALSGAFGDIIFDGEKPHESLLPLLGPVAENRQRYEGLGIADRIAAATDRNVKLPPLRLHCGTEDYLLANNRALLGALIAQNEKIVKRLEPKVADITDARQRRRKLSDLAAAERIDFTYVESPGGHDWPFWKGAAVGVAEFHHRHFAKAQPAPLATPGAK